MGITSGLITVVCSARNAQDTVYQAIESILEQTYEDTEFFIVDDCSDDGTAELVRTQIDDPRATLINLKENIGTYATKNLILHHFAEGEFFALQDADDLSWPDRLARQIEFIREHDLAACGTGIDEFFSDPQIDPRFSRDVPTYFNEMDGYYHRSNLYPETLDWHELSDPAIDVRDLKIAMNGSLMFRTQILREIGGFEGRMTVAADTDLLLRLAALYKIGNVPDVLYSRRFHADSLTASPVTGIHSELRASYVKTIAERREHIRRLLQAGKHAAAFDVACCDLFHPIVAFEFLPLGSDT